ncbi:ABC transporter ATP-binding protein [Deltaproteobacteria bacterium TL4]
MNGTQTSKIAQLNQVQFSWGKGKPLVLDIEKFEINQGEKIFVQGPSGSGKTTLLGLLGGILLPQSGEVRVLNQSLNQLRKTQRDTFRVTHIGFIFQLFNLLPYLSLVENVALPCHFSSIRRKKALERSNNLTTEATRLLTHLGLNQEAILSNPVTELSVGQQQRVAAARALIGGPEIVIADEPTSALDMESRQSFLELLFKECDLFGATLIFVSHDPALASLFDRTVTIKDLSRDRNHG